MSNSVQPERSKDRSAETEPTLAELLDPAALERRLREARERRVEAIRAREERTTRESGEAGTAPAPRPMPRALAFPDGAEIPNRPAPPRPAWTGAPAPAHPSLSREMPRPALAPRAPARELRETPVERPLSRSAPEAEARRPPPPATPARNGWNPPPAPRDPAPVAEPSTVVPARPPESAEATISKPPILKADRAVPLPKAPARPVINGLPALLLAIFLIGLIGGGAAVLFAPASFRAKIATAIAPAPERAEAPASVPNTPGAPSTEQAAPPARPMPAPETRAAEARPGPADSGADADATPPAAMETLPGEASVGRPRVAESGPAPGEPGLPDPADAEAGPTLATALPRELTVPPAPGTIGPLRLPELAVDAATDEQVATLPAPPAATPILPELDLRIETEAAPGPAEAPATGAALAQARISVHYPASATGTANDLAAALRAAGAGTANVVPVGFSVSATNVRFYHAQDRAAAEAVAAVAGGAGAAEIRDFTNFRPQPLPGVVEIWLRGAGSGGTTVARSGGATPARTPRQPDVAAPRRDLEAEAVERQLLSREVERLLRQQRGLPSQ